MTRPYAAADNDEFGVDEAADKAPIAAKKEMPTYEPGNACLVRAFLRRSGGLSGLIYPTALIIVFTAT
jgi:hypothetical protein